MDLISPSAGLFVWTVVTFLVVAGVIAKFLWKPIVQSLDAREKRIREALEASEKARADAERIQGESAAILDRARADGEAILEEARGDAGRRKEAILKEAREEADRTVERAKREIALAEGKALESLRREAAALSFEMASRILKREIRASDQEALLREAESAIAGKAGERIPGAN